MPSKGGPEINRRSIALDRGIVHSDGMHIRNILVTVIVVVTVSACSKPETKPFLSAKRTIESCPEGLLEFGLQQSPIFDSQFSELDCQFAQIPPYFFEGKSLN